MKELACFYRDQDNQPAINYIADNFYSVFGSSINITNYYLDRLAKNEKISADAYIVCYAEMLGPLVDHVDDFSKVIVIARSIRKEYIQPLFDIPRGSDVLVINDSPASIIQTIHMFYELGVGHLHLIPFNKEQADTDAYDHIDTAIVARYSEHMVPPHIHKIYNIQNREVSFETMLKLISLLDLNHSSILGNLIRKARGDMDTGTDFAKSYFSSILRMQMIKSVVNGSTRAILLIDTDQRIHYINDAACQIFGLHIGDTILSQSSLPPNMTEADEYHDRIFAHGSCTYLVDKINYYISEIYIGYALILQNEIDLRDTASNLSKQLKRTGFYARYKFDDIVHESVQMRNCIEMAQKIAVSNYTVLITGESGTGKEMLAQSIHNYSKRSKNAFVAINCAALPETLLESELFGYESGAFTGAQKKGKIGLFERANHGTLFLDEIGDISPGLQVSLLRALQEKQIMRIGSEKVIDLDVRIIAATNVDLEIRVKEGLFRRDLYYRLNVITLDIAPLRKRQEDILPLFKNFLGHHYYNLNDKEKNDLIRYSWPGNVRELANTASYYKLFNRLPDKISSCQPESIHPIDSFTEPHLLSEPLLELKVLNIIARNTRDCSGIGRRNIIKELRSEGFQVGEGVLKRILHDLNNRGLIHSFPGRGGSSITRAGNARLLKLSSELVHNTD